MDLLPTLLAITSLLFPRDDLQDPVEPPETEASPIEAEEVEGQDEQAGEDEAGTQEEATSEDGESEDPPEPEETEQEKPQVEELSGLSESDVTEDLNEVETVPGAPTPPWYERWPGGLRFDYEHTRKSGEKDSFIGTVSGLLQVDGALYNPETSTADYDDGVQIRRARLVTRGIYTGWVRTSYMIQVGYDQPNFVVNDVFAAFHDKSGRGTIQAGYFRMPMTLSGREGGRDLVMLERPAVVTAFWPNRRLGAQIAGASEGRRFSWRTGLFTIGSDEDVGNISDAPLQWSGRLTGIPYQADDSDNTDELVHVGVSGLYQFSDSSDIHYRATPESRMAPFLVDTGRMEGKQAFTLGGELALVNGPISLATEYLHSFVDGDDGNLQFNGAYVTGSWLLTGEARPYNRNLAVWSRLRPKYNLEMGNDRIGALQAVLHASYLDLSDGAVDGGRMEIVGGGLNWYWNPTVSFQLNALYADVLGGPTPGDSRILQGRLQLVF